MKIFYFIKYLNGYHIIIIYCFQARIFININVSKINTKNIVYYLLYLFNNTTIQYIVCGRNIILR